MITETVIQRGGNTMEKFLALSIKKQDTIRNAALACFARHGYEKTSINDIAVAAGISKASIFQYFGNKQTLYQYLFDYCAAQMKQAYNTSALEETTDFFDRVWEASVMKVEILKTVLMIIFVNRLYRIDGHRLNAGRKDTGPWNDRRNG